MNFIVEGKFITDLAREWFYNEHRPYDKVKELLLSCMCGTNINQKTLDSYVDDILQYKRKFIGSTKDNSFCLVDDDIQNAHKYTKYFYILKEYGKIPFEICEYGFINPQGKYIPVNWSDHAKYASDYIKNFYKNNTEDWFLFLNKYDWDATDALVKGLNWILIDNPHQGEGIIQRGNRITKKQKETLYDYYIFFNRVKEANLLYEEE